MGKLATRRVKNRWPADVPGNGDRMGGNLVTTRSAAARGCWQRDRQGRRSHRGRLISRECGDTIRARHSHGRGGDGGHFVRGNRLTIDPEEMLVTTSVAHRQPDQRLIGGEDGGDDWYEIVRTGRLAEAGYAGIWRRVGRGRAEPVPARGIIGDSSTGSAKTRSGGSWGRARNEIGCHLDGAVIAGRLARVRGSDWR